MKLSDYKNEEALELLADIIDPMATILSDDEVRVAFQTQQKMKIASLILKKHSSKVVEILARIEGVPVKEYNGTIISMTASVIDIMQDEAFSDFFTSQVQKTE